jgi:hypothetical protein
MSACAYAFLGGVNRTAKSGEVGFHQFFTPPSTNVALLSQLTDASSDAQAITGLVAVYLKEMDIDPEVLSLASKTPSADINLPDGPTMTRLRIINSHEDAQFTGWVIEPYRAGAVVTGTVIDAENRKTQITLFCRRANPGQIFLLGSWTYLIPTVNQAARETENVRSSVFGSALKIGRATVREQKDLDGIADLHVDDSGRFYLTYVLSAAEFNRGLDAGFAVEVSVPHNYGFLFRFQPPLPELREQTVIAFKSCL